VTPNEWLDFAPKPLPLKPGEKWNVFLSYRSVNRTWVLNLYDILIQAGFSVFMDQFQLSTGDMLNLRLAEGLRRSQAGILIWSHAASDSAWVLQEYQKMENRALENPEFYFVPIRLDATELPGFADNRLFLDFTSYPDGPNGGDLVHLLYGIVGKPMDAAAVIFANQQEEMARETNLEINAALRNADPVQLIHVASQETLAWKTIPSLSCKAAESLIKLGKYDEAFSILRQTEDRFPKAIRPKQLHALALARVGAAKGDIDYIRLAQRILGVLYEKGERDPETLGIYGRTWMDRYNLLGDESDLRQSRDYYVEAFDKAPDDYYTGINAAAKSVLLGTPEDIEKAQEFARRTQAIVKTEPWPNDYWKTATVAEILLIEKRYKEAGAIYAAAIRMEPGSIASHNTTYNQAIKLLAKLGASGEEQKQTLAAFKMSLPIK
jgi:tetratricopeptide (TPR) repeat protein